MTQPQQLIYLPPGVIPPAAQAPPGPVASGIPFDRAFFEQLLPRAIQAFCSQVECKIPRVEVYTVDGAVHYVNAISGVTDNIVALQTSRENHGHPIQTFVPYQTIYRVEVHPDLDESSRHLGFNLGAKIPPPALQEAAKPVPEPKTRKPAATKTR